MLNKTLLASALMIALTGTVQAANHTTNPNEGSRAGPAATANKPASARSTGSPSTPTAVHNDGSRSTAHGALSTGPDYGQSKRYHEYRGASSPYSARASDFIGADVISSGNGSIGEIDDVIMSRSDNKLHAVIDVGGHLGTGERLVSVPIDDLRMDSNGNVYLDTANAQLQQREQFGYYGGEDRGSERMSRREKILANPTRQ